MKPSEPPERQRKLLKKVAHAAGHDAPGRQASLAARQARQAPRAASRLAPAPALALVPVLVHVDGPTRVRARAQDPVLGPDQDLSVVTVVVGFARIARLQQLAVLRLVEADEAAILDPDRHEPTRDSGVTVI